VGSVRGRLVTDGPAGEEWEVDRLMVAPDLQGAGLGRWLLARGEELAPDQAGWLTLLTGAADADLRLYARAGYRPAPDQPDPGVVRLRKRRR
jgi:tRNA (guanine37-N1)-methyltransferase